MVFAVDVAESGGVDVRVNLGRANIRVAKKFLNGSNVRTM